MQIRTTSDYSLFKRIPGNRTINKNHVKQLMQSISEDTDLAQCSPVIVNDKMQVIDGQHRLEAYKTLGLPVYYLQVEGKTLDDVQKLNSKTKLWNPLDYAKSFVELGNKHYEIYLDFRKRFHLPHNVIMNYLGNGSGKGKQTTKEMFRNGKFKVVNQKEAEVLCKQLKDVGKYYPESSQQTFALGFRVIATNPKYKHMHMLEQLSKHQQLIVDCLTSEDYVRMLERIYNYRVKTESNRVRFF